MSNDAGPSGSSEESSSDSEEGRNTIEKESFHFSVASSPRGGTKLLEVKPSTLPPKKFKVESGSSDSDSGGSESEDSKTDVTRVKPSSSDRLEKVTAGSNGISKVESPLPTRSEKNGKVDTNRIASNKPAAAGEDEKSADARRALRKIESLSVKAALGEKSNSRPILKESSKASPENKKRSSPPQVTSTLAKRRRNSVTASVSAKSPCKPHKWLKEEEISLADALRQDSKNGIVFPKDKGNKHWQSVLERLDISDPPLNINQFHEKIRRMKSKYLSMRKTVGGYSPSWRQSHDGRLYEMWDCTWGKRSLNSILSGGEDDDDDDGQTPDGQTCTPDKSSDSEDEEAKVGKLKAKSTSADFGPLTGMFSEGLGFWSVGPQVVAQSKRLPEIRDTPLEFRKPLLQLKKRYGEIYREQIMVAEIRLKSGLHQCEVERNLSLLQYETDKFLARLPVNYL